MTMQVLDLGSGKAVFEDELRTAIMGVVKAWNKRRAELKAYGRRERYAAHMKTMVHPFAEADEGRFLRASRLPARRQP